MTKRTLLKPIKASFLQATVHHNGWSSAQVIKRTWDQTQYCKKLTIRKMKCKIDKFGGRDQTLQHMVVFAPFTTFKRSISTLAQNCTSYDL